MNDFSKKLVLGSSQNIGSRKRRLRRLVSVILSLALASTMAIFGTACIRVGPHNSTSENTDTSAENSSATTASIKSPLTLISSPDGKTASITPEYIPAMEEFAEMYPSFQINDSGQVVFESAALNLPGANSFSQIYLWSPQSGLKLISSPDGKASGAGGSNITGSHEPQINDKGQVVFTSNSTNLPGANGLYQIYFWDPIKGVKLVSSHNGKAGSIIPGTYVAGSHEPLINDRGQVVFTSDASGLPGANGSHQVYLWDSKSGVKLISSPDGKKGGEKGYGNGSDQPKINNAGQIVFYSDAPNLPGANESGQIYFWQPNGGLSLVSGFERDAAAQHFQESFAINDSGEGVFDSNALNLPGANGFAQVYLWRPKGALTLISSPDGKSGGAGVFPDSGSVSPRINNKGQIVFESDAGNLLVSDDSHKVIGKNQIYLWDPKAGLSLVSKYENPVVDNIQGTFELLSSTLAVISVSDGYEYWAGFADYQLNDSGKIVFSTDNPSLPGTDTQMQIYCWDSYNGLRLVSSPDSKIGGNQGSYTPVINNSGQVAFESDATNLLGYELNIQTNSNENAIDYLVPQIYLWNAPTPY